MPQDIHQAGDSYAVRSLYFDDIWDSCLDENEAGIDYRTKIRIRIYDIATERMHLETKEKVHGMTAKTVCDITRQEYRQLILREGILAFDGRKPLNLLQLLMRISLMKPRLITLYERTAFIYPTGNVRITFDRNIMASQSCEDFLRTDIACCVPVMPTGMHVLEVKYDELLPDHISQLLEIGKLQLTAFSKYYLGRLAVQGEFAVTGR